jgi:hypothetical protein
VRLTSRDIRLIKDVALSQLLSRDQIIRLGYFTSVTRANTRLRSLRAEGYLSLLTTPYFWQFLYAPGKRATTVVGERISALLADRAKTPRFIQHSLAVTDVRIALARLGATDWRFEAQSRHPFLQGSSIIEIRPDGLVHWPGQTAIEVDMGHVDPKKFSEKLRAYAVFVASGELQRVWGADSLTLLTVTTGNLRKSRLLRLVAGNASFGIRFETFEELGISRVGGWS